MQQCSHSLAVRPYLSHLTSLGFSFLLCKGIHYGRSQVPDIHYQAILGPASGGEVKEDGKQWESCYLKNKENGDRLMDGEQDGSKWEGGVR